MATSIAGLIERFYGELWNRWNDAAVDDTLSPDFRFRGSLGRETLGRHGWRQYRDLVHAGSTDFRNEIIELVCEGGGRRPDFATPGRILGCCWGCPHAAAFLIRGYGLLHRGSSMAASAYVLGDLDGLRAQLG